MFPSRRQLLAAGAILALSIVALHSVPNTTTAAPASTAPARYIVVFKDAVRNVDTEIDQQEAAHGFKSDFRYHYAIKGFAATLTQQQRDAIGRNPNVAFVSDDREVQAVDSAPLAAGETAPTGVRRIQAATTTVAHKASSVNVAVIDTGIDLTHPDLNAVSGTNCVQSGTSAQDDNGHGTHVSGTIAAKNTGSGVVGVAPGTLLYAAKVLNSRGSGTWSQVICGIDWVTANAASLNIKVASMSLGGSGSNDSNCGNTNADALHQAICRSTAWGVTYVVAAGNSSADLATFVPAAYPEALTVTAMSDSDGAPGAVGGAPSCRTSERDDYYASFSNYATAASEISHTIAGPGVCIYSDWTGGGYNTISGTSMATPHVSGTVALCLGEAGAPGPCAGMTPSQVIQKLRADAANYSNSNSGYGFTGDPNHPVGSKYYGYLALASVTPPVPDFSIAGSPSSQSVIPGGSTTYTATVTALNGYGSPVNLTVSGLPLGATGTFSPNPVAPTSSGATSTLSVTTTALTPTGTYTLTITGTGTDTAATTHSTTVKLVVATPDFSISASPSSRRVKGGNNTSYTITLTATSGYGSPVNLSASGLPAGASVAFSPNPVTPTSGGATSTMTVATSRSTPNGSYVVTIMGTGTDASATTHSTTVTLNVR